MQRSTSGSTELAASAEQMSKMSRTLLESMDRFVLEASVEWQRQRWQHVARPCTLSGRRTELGHDGEPWPRTYISSVSASGAKHSACLSRWCMRSCACRRSPPSRRRRTTWKASSTCAGRSSPSSTAQTVRRKRDHAEQEEPHPGGRSREQDGRADRGCGFRSSEAAAVATSKRRRTCLKKAN